jgi:DNA-binding NarL/FixJ family response regulator
MSDGLDLTMLHATMYVPASAAPAAHDRARISVVIASRHPAMRSSLRAALDGDSRVHLFGAAEDLRNTIAAASRLPAGVLGMGDHPAYAAHARRAGAADYVRLDQAADRLPQAIQAAVSA